MAIRKIARMGHPVLREPAAPVVDPTAPEIHALVADMYETMIDADGLGIAAPQVYVPLRVVIFFMPESGDASSERELVVLINPTIEPLDDSIAGAWEGCLSVPGLRGWVERPERIRYRATALDGSAIDRDADGMHARVVQHECDHLDGRLYPTRMTDISSLVFTSEWRHYVGASAATRATERESDAD